MSSRSVGKIILIILVFGLLLFMSVIMARGQFLPYLPYYSQPYFPFPTIPYFSPYIGTNPYIGLYNPFSFLNSTTSLIGSPIYPQASVAGSLIPFTGLYPSPFIPFYSAAAVNYIAAAVIPADVSGTWSGVWVSTFLAGGITTGDLSMTLAQAGADVTGTTAFFLNKILKFGADVVGTVEGNALTLTSTIVPSLLGTKSFDVTISAIVNGGSMEGTYVVINNVTGLVAEEGTFTAVRL